MVHACGAFRRVGIPAEGVVQCFAVQSILDEVQIVAEVKVVFLHMLAELRAVRFKIIKPNAELFIVNAENVFSACLRKRPAVPRQSAAAHRRA